MLTDAERDALAGELATLEEKRYELRGKLGLLPRRFRGIAPSEEIKVKLEGFDEAVFRFGFIPWAALSELQGDGMLLGGRMDELRDRMLASTGEAQGAALRDMKRVAADVHRLSCDLVRRVVRGWEIPGAPAAVLEEIEYDGDGVLRPVLSRASVEELDGRGYIGALSARINEQFALTLAEKKS